MNRRHDTHTTDEALEGRLRTMLRTRADDVEATPALYGRVRTGIDRASRRPLWLGAAGVAAALAATAIVVPQLLDDEPTLSPDIAEEPDATPTPAPTPTADPTPGPSEGATAAPEPGVSVDAGFAVSRAGTGVTVEHDTGSTLIPNDGEAVEPAVALRVEGRTLTAAAVTVGGVDRVVLHRGRGGPSGTVSVEATPNGGGLAFVPEGEGVAWIEGSELVLWAPSTGVELDDPAALRRFPLEEDVPGDLVVEQFVGFDAPLLLASSASQLGIWRLPMDVGGPTDTAPTGPVEPLPSGEGAADLLILPDLSTLALLPATGGGEDGATPAVLRHAGIDGERLQTLPFGTADTTIGLRSAGGDHLVVGSATSGEVLVEYLGAGPAASDRVVEVLDVFGAATGVVRTPALLDDELRTFLAGGTDTGGDVPTDPASAGDDQAATEAGAASPGGDGPLGLSTDLPVLAADGGTVVVIGAGMDEQRVQVYQEPVEGALVGLAVRPGSRVEDFTVALESVAEGEVSVRLVRVVDGAITAAPAIVDVTEGDVTSLVWSEDGRALAWTEGRGTVAVTVEPDGATGEPSVVDTNLGPLADWVWTEVGGDALAGHVTREVELDLGRLGHRLVGVSLDATGTVTFGDEVGGGDTLPLDTHANPGAAVGPEWDVQQSVSQVTFRLHADGDTNLDVGSVGVTAPPVAYRASGGVLVVVTDPGTDDGVRRVDADGTVRELPLYDAYDVLD